MPDVGAYLDRKYSILRQNANSDEELKRAQTALTTSQAETNPGEAAAREAQGFGAGAQGQGFGAYYRSLAATQPGLAQSEIALRGAQGDAASAGAESTRAATGYANSGISPDLLRLIQGREGQGGLQQNNIIGGSPSGFADGTSKVADKGGKPMKPGSTDTTPAMLTPGEAVLNVGAAEHLGRSVIDVLNAIGSLKMGKDGTASQTEGPATKAPIGGEGGLPGYALGTPNVQNPSPFGTGGAGAGASAPKPIDPIAGQGGTWVSQGGGGNNAIRQSTGLTGVPRLGFADGTAQVPDTSYHNDTIMKARGEDRSPSMGDQGVREGDTSSSPKTQKGSAVAGYSKGTSKVPSKGKPAKADKGGGVTPELISKIMAMGKGGGGLIPPGQGAPMPMNMPQLAPGG